MKFYWGNLVRAQADPRLGGAPHATGVRGQEMVAAGLSAGNIATLWHDMPAGTFEWEITHFEVFALGIILKSIFVIMFGGQMLSEL